MTETLEYSRIGKEDIRLKPRVSSAEVRLADGRVVVLSSLDVAYLVADAYTRATLPTEQLATGQLARVTDEANNIVLWDGTAWVSVVKITTRGDLVAGAASGVPARLAIGAAGRLLSSDGTDPAWGQGPLTTTGDLLIGATAGTPTRLALGTERHVLEAGASTFTWALPMYHGQCRLTKSGVDLLLSPQDGTRLIINSTQQVIPDAGVTLAPTGLLANTTYFIYAFMSAGVMTLEASTTTHATQAGTGVKIKTGDATRTLVGMARIITGPAWVDTATQRFVLSWFARRRIGGTNAFTTNKTTASTSYVELSTTEGRIEFLTWADEAVDVAYSGRNAHTVAGQGTLSTIGFDGATAEDAMSGQNANAANEEHTIAGTITTALAEGYHFATFLGRVSAGAPTGTWNGSATVGERCAMHIGIQG